MSDTESFEQAMDFANTVVAYCDIPLLDRLQAAHDREIRDTAQQEYDRGFHDGQHSMDAEHRAVSMRLRHLPLDGGSHENLSQIARAVYHADFGWTQGACMSLRDELVRLMGGVPDDRCCAGGGACAADCGRDSGEQTEVGDGRAADDSADDSRGGSRGDVVHLDGLNDDRTCPNDDTTSSITHELRKFVDRNWPEILHETKTTKPYVLLAIADRIDERVRLGAIKADTYRFYANQMREERDELQAKLDMCYRHASVEDVVLGITLGTYSMTEGIERLERIYGSD